MVDSLLVTKLIPLYILVGFGFLAGRQLSIKGQEIGRLLLYFLSPAVIFRGFFEAEFDGTILLLPMLTLLMACFLGWIGLQTARYKWRDGTERILAFSSGTGNTGFFGIPATLSLLGDEAFPYLVISVFGFIAYEVSYGYYIVMRIHSGGKKAFLRVLAYPGLHACWMGLFFNAFDLTLPDFASTTITYLTDGYTLLGMMIVGLGLAEMKTTRLDFSYLCFSLGIKFLVWPLAMAGVVALDRTLFGLIPELAQWVLLCASLMPMAAMTIVHATVQNSDPDKASVAVGLSTLFALVYLPFGLAVFRLLF